jgi:hypothetical protein
MSRQHPGNTHGPPHAAAAARRLSMMHVQAELQGLPVHGRREAPVVRKVCEPADAMTLTRIQNEVQTRIKVNARRMCMCVLLNVMCACSEFPHSELIIDYVIVL